MKKINKISCLVFVFVLLVVVFTSNVQSVYAEEVEIMAPARGMVVLEGNSNTVLYGFNADKQLAMASTTKIATCIVAIENCQDLDRVVKVSDKAVGIEGTSIYLKKGEEIVFKDLLYGLMLASGNDCSVALAEEICGEEKFVEKMNELAQKVGALNTHFVNPHGLDADGHYTTAHDLALITSYALKNPIFREISSTQYHTIAPTNVYEQSRYLKHKNKLLFTDENCIGVKTGFTDNAGRCLVSASEKDGLQIISVVLNCGPMFEECNRLTKLAFANYEWKEFVKPYNYVGSIDVLEGDKEEIGVSTVSGFGLPILKAEEELYRVEYDIPKSLTAPVGLNEPIGTVKVFYNDGIIFEDELTTINEVKNIDLRHMIDNIIDKWF